MKIHFDKDPKENQQKEIAEFLIFNGHLTPFQVEGQKRTLFHGF